MAILIRYAPSSLTREQYDKVNEILQENGPDGPPPALQLHVLFGEEPDLRFARGDPPSRTVESPEPRRCPS